MAQPFYVAVPYASEELSEAEERHETWEYIEYDHYDCRGWCGEVLLDGEWQTVWAFGSEAEALRFVKGWRGMLLDEAAQVRVTKHRWPDDGEDRV